MNRTKSPRESLEVLAQWGTDNLTRVIAIDSQSDDTNDAIPSSQGQRALSDHLRGFFTELGHAAEQDDNANLIVTIPGNAAAAPAVALMVHMDTSEGTRAVPALETTPAWDGGRVRYPHNDRLQVTAENYPETACFRGDDLLHGPGRFPIGLDDKLGMAELMTLAQVLQKNPELLHGTLLLVFRPDEEIGRMAAVEGLADELARRGVRYGYTIDGIEPFEINVENFNAARGRVGITGARLALAGERRRVRFRIAGVNTHGATARAEGHRNATVLWARALERLGERDDIAPIGFASDPRLECNAEVSFAVCGGSPEAVATAERDLEDALQAEIAPHEWKGAHIEQLGSEPMEAASASDVYARLARHLRRFLDTPGVTPLLAEDSAGFEGYSNPHTVEPVARASDPDGAEPGGGETAASGDAGDSVILHYRFRDFDRDGLAEREEHLRRVCRADGIDPSAVRTEREYINMGPKLAEYPQLVRWAEEALAAVGREPVRRPIRGGTGVDPFLAREIPVANLGTGYFAPESEKEFTSRQNIARHTLWLAHLVQIIAAPAVVAE